MSPVKAMIPHNINTKGPYAQNDNDTIPAEKSYLSTIRYDLHATTTILPSPYKPTLQHLYASLAQVFEDTKASGTIINRHQSKESFSMMDSRIRSLISNYINSNASDWKNYVQFNQHHYIRHLVDANDDFELIVICWANGQASRVHNHADSHCWLTVMEGTVEEHRFQEQSIDDTNDDTDTTTTTTTNTTTTNTSQLPGVVQTASPCPDLIPDGVTVANRGTTAYINDGMGLHAVKCPESCVGQGAVTLHLYSPPITRVKLYDESANQVIVRQPGFYSKKGVKV